VKRPISCVAVTGERIVAHGGVAEVALAVKAALQADETLSVLVFDAQAGRLIDFDLRGSDEEVIGRLTSEHEDKDETTKRGRGRPKLGVIAREITLLPRHWEWLGAQPGGASVALRKLVEAARMRDDQHVNVKHQQQVVDRFMCAALGNQPHYEDASRALYARNRDKFFRLTEEWPIELRDHVRWLAQPVFEGTFPDTNQ
jgi:hypothetical protein